MLADSHPSGGCKGPAVPKLEGKAEAIHEEIATLTVWDIVAQVGATRAQCYR